MNALRPFLAAALVVTALALGSAAADASCLLEPQADRAARAEAVVYGRVVRTEGAPAAGAPGRVAIVQAERIFKGSVPARFTVALGPDMGGGVAVGPTSVDYVAETGTDHTLFLRKRGPDSFETDACAGSHAGQPTAEETAFLGAGSAPEPMVGGIAGVDGRVQAAALAMLILVAAAAAAILYARSSSRRAATT